jgi:dTDP-4-amino-4,6-dideoxygalactose transaminase
MCFWHRVSPSSSEWGKMIPLLIPDLPPAADVLPFLEEMDRNRWYTNFGPLVLRFEGELSQLLMASGLSPGDSPPVAVTTSSGTAALELSLLSLDLPPGSAVLIPAFTFPATAWAVQRCGLTPVLADSSPDTWLLTPAIARKTLRHIRAAAVMPVAALGCPLPAGEWDAFSRETGLPVVMDAAGALGAQETGQSCLAAFSFHATKPFGIGEGGMVVTREPERAARIRSLSKFGYRTGGGTTEEPGTNAKLSEYHAAVGLAQLARWDKVVASRREIWRIYRQNLQQIVPAVRLQEAPDCTVPSTMAARFDTCDVQELAKRLRAEGIATRRWYYPLTRHASCQDLPRVGPDGGADLPETEALGDTLLGLPFHPWLQEGQIHRICRLLASHAR